MSGVALRGPRWPSWYAAIRLAADPLGLYTRLAHKYGEVFAIKFPGFPEAAVACDLDLAEAVFADAETFSAGRANALVFGPLDGDRSVVTVDGPDHRRLRRSLGPAASWGRRNEALVAGAFAREIEGWPRGRPLAVRPRVERVVLDVLLRGTLGVGRADDPELAVAVRRLAQRARPILSSPPLRRNLGPVSPWQRFLHARQQLDRLLAPRLAGTPAADCAVATLKAAGPEGECFSERELRDQVVTLLMAGYEGTATAIAWEFERLAAHPHEMERARTGGREALDSIAREALRLRPPFTQVWRRCTTPADLGEHRFNAGSLVVIPISALHHNRDLFDEPDSFRPDRHRDGAVRGWMPFGGGVRSCLGASTARQMMVAALAAALERGAIEPASDRPERPVLRGGTVEPARGGRIVLQGGRREGAAVP